jgi:hypothetical protein
LVVQRFETQIAGIASQRSSADDEQKAIPFLQQRIFLIEIGWIEQNPHRRKSGS